MLPTRPQFRCLSHRSNPSSPSWGVARGQAGIILLHEAVPVLRQPRSKALSGQAGRRPAWMLQPCSDVTESSLQESSLLDTEFTDDSVSLCDTLSEAELETMSLTNSTSESTPGKIKLEPLSLRCCCFTSKNLCVSAMRGCLACTGVACSSIRVVGYGCGHSISEALSLQPKYELAREWTINILNKWLRHTLSVRTLCIFRMTITVPAI